MTTSKIVTIPDICELRRADDGSYEIDLNSPLSLVALRNSDIGRKLLHLQDWYKAHSFSAATVPARTYRVRLPIPGSNNRTFGEQCKLLLPGEEPIPVALAAAALLCLRKEGHPDPLQSGWMRCAETTAVRERVELAWDGDRLGVYDLWNDFRHASMWLGSAHRINPAA